MTTLTDDEIIEHAETLTRWMLARLNDGTTPDDLSGPLFEAIADVASLGMDWVRMLLSAAMPNPLLALEDLA